MAKYELSLTIETESDWDADHIAIAVKRAVKGKLATMDDRSPMTVTVVYGKQPYAITEIAKLTNVENND